MKIVVLTGSPHRNGTSSYLANKFIEGAIEAGHEVTRFDAAFEDVHPCMACGTCKTDNKCVFNDSMCKIYDKLLESDAIIFVTPMYSHGVTAQLKAVIDRFYMFGGKLRSFERKSALIMTAAANNTYYTGITGMYLESLRHNKWQNSGMVLAVGCAVLEDVINSDYPRQAYELGKSI